MLRVVPVITKFEDFEIKLSGFLNKSKKLAVLLDYDGTLAPITDNPNKAAMSPEVRDLLNKICKHNDIFTAVISGRGLTDVKKHIGINGVTFAGNHGLEIEYPDGSRHDYELPSEIQASYKSMVAELNKKLQINKAWIEDKRVSLTYHYRDTPPLYKEVQKTEAIRIIESYGFRANLAHEAIEAKPAVSWNKGEAALYILKDKFGVDWASKVAVVFVGDDTTDEDAMRALQGLGISFRISNNAELKTFADYRLPCQSLVTDLFKWIESVYVN